MTLTISEILAILSPILSIAVSSGITVQRIKQLEKTVDKHNKFAERIPQLELKIEMIEKRIDKIEEMGD